jgi:hypothetical protein
MTIIRAMVATAIMALIISLSVAPAGAEYPPSDEPDNPTTTVKTQVAGIQETNNANLAFTGRSIGTFVGLGVVLVAAGGLLFIVGQRRDTQSV